MKNKVLIAGHFLLLLFIFTGCMAMLNTSLTSSNQSLPLPNLETELDDPAKARIYLIRPGQGMYAVADIPQVFIMVENNTTTLSSVDAKWHNKKTV